MKINKNKFIHFLKEGLETEAERLNIDLDTSGLESRLDSLIDKLEDLDVSLDYLAAAFTGESALNVDIAQSTFGRSARPMSRPQKTHETPT